MSNFGRYQLVRRVGTGGMAEIWKARMVGPAGFEKVLAIKKVLPHLVEDGEFIQMFIEEAKLVATLVHPNIVQVFDFGTVGKNDYFIAMEYVAGTNLAMILKRLHDRGARMPLEVALYVVAEASKGLGYAHSRTSLAGEDLAIVHRDVSPQNVLVSFGGEVKVTDFGIAKVASALSRTAEGHVRGKLAYMSPEQANTQPLDARSDLFSLGVVLYELLTGKRLFYGSSGSEIFARVTSFKPPTDAELPNIAYEVKQIVRQALEPDRDDRFQTAMEMEHALTTALGPEGIVQARHALSSIVQRLFDEERKLEMTSDLATHSPSPDDQRTSQVPSGAYAAQSASSSVSTASGEGAVPAVAPSQAPTIAPSQSSGLTLAKSSVRPVPASVLPAPPPKKRSGMDLLLLGMGFVVMLAIAAVGGGVFLPQLLHSKSAPTPYPTIVAATSTPTPAADTTATPAPTRVAHATPVPIVHSTPVPVQTRVAALDPGFLTINAKPWVSVYVDDRLATSETPLRHFKLTAGKHSVKFVNAPANFQKSVVVNVTADADLSLFVDVKANQVKSGP